MNPRMNQKTLFLSSLLLCTSNLWGNDKMVSSASSISSDSAEEILPAPDARNSSSPATSLSQFAPKALGEFQPTVKFSGYVTGRYAYSDQKGLAAHGSFETRYLRLIVNGQAWQNLAYFVQFEMAGAPGIDRGPRIHDAYLQWEKFKFVRLKFGQFNRAFGFDSPIAPIKLEMGSFSQVATKLQGLTDRLGERPTGCRDLGVQLNGDLFPMADGHTLLHYHVGVFNGQGGNHKDYNNHKDLVGGLWISPVKNLRIAAFGWDGRSTDEKNTAVSVNRKRYGLGLSYEADWMFRGEYVHSVGATYAATEAAMKAATPAAARAILDASNRSDGWYAMAGGNIKAVPGLKVYGRWDCYRDNARTWNSLKTDWGLSASYWFNTHFMMQFNYTHTYDRSAATSGADRRYNVFDVQATARF